MFGALLDGRTLTRVPIIISIFWSTTSYSWQSQCRWNGKVFEANISRPKPKKFNFGKLCLLDAKKSWNMMNLEKNDWYRFLKGCLLQRLFVGKPSLWDCPGIWTSYYWQRIPYLLLTKSILFFNFYQLTSIEDNGGGAASSSAPVMILVWQTLSLMKHCSWANLISNISR